MPEPPAAPPAPRFRFRLSVRALLLLIAAVGLAMGLGRFWLANRNPDRAMLSHQFRTLADRDAPPGARLAAIDEMANARGREEHRALTLLVAALDDPNERVRAGSARMIQALGARILDEPGPKRVDLVRPAARALLGAADDPSPEAASRAIESLRWLDRDPANPLVDPEATAARLLPLASGDRGREPGRASARIQAIVLLADREPEAGVVPAWLKPILGDPDPRVRLAALQSALTLVKPGPSARMAAEAPGWLLRALGDDDPEVRSFAVWGCGDWVWTMSLHTRVPVWSNTDEVGAALLRRLDEAEGDDRLALITNLGVNAPEAAAGFAPEVIGGLEDRLEDHPREWGYHLNTLGALGPAARPAVPLLREAARRVLDHEDVWICEQIVRLVVAIDPDSAEAQALLDDLLDFWADAPQWGNLRNTIASYGPSGRPKLARLRRIGERHPNLRFDVRAIATAFAPDLDPGPPVAPEPFPPERGGRRYPVGRGSPRRIGPGDRAAPDG